MNYSCENDSCDQVRKTVGEELARFLNMKCFKCGGELRAEAADEPETLVALVDGFPSLFACLLKDYLDEKNPVLKIWHMCDFMETLLRFSVFAGISELRAGDRLEPAILQCIRDNIQHPTMGKWNMLSRQIWEGFEGHESMLPQMAATMRSVTETFMRDFIPIRNVLAHGGGVTRGKAEKLLLEWKDRFEEVVSGLEWMTHVGILVGTEDGRYHLLRGPGGKIEAGAEHAPVVEKARKLGRYQDEVFLINGPQILTLWPLAVYGYPRQLDPDHPVAAGEVSQIYIRKDHLNLIYATIGSDEVCSSVSSPEANEDLQRLILLAERTRPETPHRFEVRDFGNDIRKEAHDFVGREAQVEVVKNAILNTEQGVVWLSGSAGMGKSYLVSSVAHELAASLRGTDSDLILVFRFKAGDDRCSREKFLVFVNERITACERFAYENKNEVFYDRKKSNADIFEVFLAHLGGLRLKIIIDGLDEIAEKDPKFITDVILRNQRTHLLWFCSGRPDHGLSETFRKAGAWDLFPAGLPRMSVADIRGMILDKIGYLKKKLLAVDRDQGECVTNEFIDRVCHNADGFPIYVKYVIGDILSGKLKNFDKSTVLPASLTQYHEELLSRCRIGSLQQILTPLAAYLAVAFEPLRIADFVDFFRRLNLMDGHETTEASRELVGKGLAYIQSMIKATTNSFDEEAYTLFHHSLRQHMEESPSVKGALGTARDGFCRLARELGQPAEEPEAGRRYLYRWGLSHLMQRGYGTEVMNFLTDFSYLAGRLRALGHRSAVLEISADWKLLPSETGTSGRSKLFRDFWLRNEHFMMRGDPQWPAERILHQLAMYLSNQHPLTQQAQAWSKAHCTWKFLRLSEADQDPRVYAEPCLYTLASHSDYVNCCAVSADGRLALTGAGKELGDNTIRVWDLNEHETLHVLRGHELPVISVEVSRDARLAVSTSIDQTVRLWDLSSGECKRVLAPGAIVKRAVFSPAADQLLCCDEAMRLRKYDIANECWQTESRLPELANSNRDHKNYPIRAVRTDKTRELEWNLAAGVNGLVTTHDFKYAVTGDETGTVVVWDIESLEAVRTLSGHRWPVLTCDISPDGKWLVSGDIGGDIILWDFVSGTLLGRYHHQSYSVRTLRFTADSQRLLVGSGYIHTEPGRRNVECRLLMLNPDDLTSGATSPVRPRAFVGHTEAICDMARIGTDQVLTASWDGVVKCWDLTTPEQDVKAEPEIGWVESILLSPDGAGFVTASDDAVVRIWNTKTRALELALVGHDFSVTSAAILSHDQVVLSVAEDMRMILWDRKTGQLRAEVPLSSEAHFPNMLPFACGRLVLLLSHQKGRGTLMEILDLASGRRRSRLLDGITVKRCAISPDQQTIALTNAEKTLLLVDVPTGEVRYQMTNPNPEWETCEVVFSPTNEFLYYSDYQGVIRKLEVATGKLVQELVGHLYEARSMSISKDGRYLASGGTDFMLRVWETDSGNLVSVAMFEAWPVSVSFLDHEYRIVLGFSNGAIQVVELENGQAQIPIVTGFRPWIPEADPPDPAALSGQWGPQYVYRCPYCGESQALPGDGIWGEDEPRVAANGLVSDQSAERFIGFSVNCQKCEGSIVLNAFVADNRALAEAVSRE